MIWFSRMFTSSTLRDCPSSGASSHFWERSRFYGDSMPPYDPVAYFLPSINVSLINLFVSPQIWDLSVDSTWSCPERTLTHCFLAQCGVHRWLLSPVHDLSIYAQSSDTYSKKLQVRWAQPPTSAVRPSRESPWVDIRRVNSSLLFRHPFSRSLLLLLLSGPLWNCKPCTVSTHDWTGSLYLVNTYALGNHSRFLKVSLYRNRYPYNLGIQRT